jgi:CheY-like chemotaxis protein
MHKMELSVEALANLFNTILDISKLDAQVVAPQVEEFPLAPIFATIALLYTPQAVAKGLALRFRHTDCIVRSDPELLDRILRNLVSNAIRHTEHGRVLVGLRHRGESVEILVCDTGIGIPPDRTIDIFKEFVQLGNPTHDRSRGLGLGLSIVERLAKLLAHEITVRSKPGRGSCFSVRVPVVAIPKIRRDIAAPASFSKSKLKGAFIVVVDDEEEILMGMEALLTAHGCHCVCATSSRALLEKLEDHSRQADLIITDFRVGAQETGLDVIHAIREAQQLEVPALVVTGSQGAVGEYGFPVIRKPVLERELIALISELLGAATAHQQPILA